ncbi:MAG: glycosyltransferase family 4 protein [Rhodospirillales bacterium]
MGRFETHRVIFLGRLSRQKGIDRLCEVADRVARQRLQCGLRRLWRRPGKLATRPPPHKFRRRTRLGQTRHGIPRRQRAARPSHAEPFGMVVLEAMQHRVPVIYPAESGAAEVLQNGIKIAAGDTAEMAGAVMHLLGDLSAWEEAVVAAAREIEHYPERGYEDRLIAVWTEAMAVRSGSP